MPTTKPKHGLTEAHKKHFTKAVKDANPSTTDPQADAAFQNFLKALEGQDEG